MFFILGIMQVTFVTESILDLPTASLDSKGTGTRAKTSAMLQSTCPLSSSCRYLGSKWGGPRKVLGLKGEAIHHGRSMHDKQPVCERVS